MVGREIVHKYRHNNFADSIEIVYTCSKFPYTKRAMTFVIPNKMHHSRFRYICPPDRALNQTIYIKHLIYSTHSQHKNASKTPQYTHTHTHTACTKQFFVQLWASQSHICRVFCAHQRRAAAS